MDVKYWFECELWSPFILNLWPVVVASGTESRDCNHDIVSPGPTQ